MQRCFALGCNYTGFILVCLCEIEEVINFNKTCAVQYILELIPFLDVEILVLKGDLLTSAKIYPQTMIFFSSLLIQSCNIFIYMFIYPYVYVMFVLKLTLAPIVETLHCYSMLTLPSVCSRALDTPQLQTQ